ncbi:DUF6879 family protein [Streptomyces roseifaciens]|uniref:DUF6879 family protein n=1 Tax=Streptomyces roseifaciens TaxID=1488406 RepID=UPI0030B843AC
MRVRPVQCGQCSTDIEEGHGRARAFRGNHLGVRILEDAESVVRACQVRDAAWHHAVPTKSFQAQLRPAV